MLDFIPGRRIELRQSLENALRSFESGTGLVNALLVIIVPVSKHIILYHIPDTLSEDNVWKEAGRQTDSEFTDSKGISRAPSTTGSK